MGHLLHCDGTGNVFTEPTDRWVTITVQVHRERPDYLQQLPLDEVRAAAPGLVDQALPLLPWLQRALGSGKVREIEEILDFSPDVPTTFVLQRIQQVLSSLRDGPPPGQEALQEGITMFRAIMGLQRPVACEDCGDPVDEEAFYLANPTALIEALESYADLPAEDQATLDRTYHTFVDHGTTDPVTYEMVREAYRKATQSRSNT